jgi:hypothetical protein
MGCFGARQPSKPPTPQQQGVKQTHKAPRFSFLTSQDRQNRLDFNNGHRLPNFMPKTKPKKTGPKKQGACQGTPSKDQSCRKLSKNQSW